MSRVFNRSDGTFVFGRRTVTVATVLTASALVVGGGFAFAAAVTTSSPPVTFYACQNTKMKVISGSIMVGVKPKCSSGFEVVSWNATGPVGPAGSIGPTGPAGPSGATGPSGAPGVNGTDGTDGSRWLSGAGAPADDLGSNGDFYLDTSNGDVYSKYSSGAGGGGWHLQTNLQGKDGADGTLGTVIWRRNTVNVFGSGIHNLASACLAGEQVLGSGLDVQTIDYTGAAYGDPPLFKVYESHPTIIGGAQGWSVKIDNGELGTGGVSGFGLRVTVTALCA